MNAEKTEENTKLFEKILDATTKRFVNHINSKATISTKLIVKPTVTTRQNSSTTKLEFDVNSSMEEDNIDL
jgi:hypothetical protein